VTVPAPQVVAARLAVCEGTRVFVAGALFLFYPRVAIEGV
jgi:hypothetical protein